MNSKALVVVGVLGAECDLRNIESFTGVYKYIVLSVCMSVYLSVCPSIFLSVCLSIWLSVSLVKRIELLLIFSSEWNMWGKITYSAFLWKVKGGLLCVILYVSTARSFGAMNRILSYAWNALSPSRASDFMLLSMNKDLLRKKWPGKGSRQLDFIEEKICVLKIITLIEINISIDR